VAAAHAFLSGAPVEIVHGFVMPALSGGHIAKNITGRTTLEKFTNYYRATPLLLEIEHIFYSGRS
jgi:hypothetical protein